MKRSHLLFSLLYLALLFGIGVSSTNSSKKNYLCDQGDSLLLLQFIKHFEIHEADQFLCHGGYGMEEKLSWDESSDCCQWEGVTCDTSTGHVIGLDLYCNGLKGSIHRNSTLFQLQHLQKLNLAMNNFGFSPLPNEIGSLTHLTYLDLSYSRLSGSIPFEMSHLSKLVYLDLSFNFDGNVSRLLFLQNFTKLEVLFLSENSISSTIPGNISASLQDIDLSDNNIIGPIPDSISQLSELKSLDLHGNVDLVSSLPKFGWRSNHTLKILHLSETGIFGELSNSIGNFRSLNYFRLSKCRFFGVIHDSIGNLTHLKELSLDSNEFKGSVPFTISNLNQLTTLDLSSNHFEGEIPDAFSNLQEVTVLGLYGNNFTGCFPSSIVNLSLLEDLNLEGYSLIGSLPSVASGFQTLQTLSLSRNALIGKIPPWIFSSPFLTHLDLSQNQFMGQLPEISSKSLSFANLSHNRLDGQIPPTFFKLEELDLSFNLFSWSNDWRMPEVNISDLPIRDLRLSSCEIRKFPDFIRNLTSLESLDLSNNKLEGQIPNWFASVYWRNMYSLDLSQNHLIGGINQLWIPLLGYLDLHSNQLQGPLTVNICNSSQLQFLNLRCNKFNGTIPDCLGELYELSVLDLAMNNFNAISPTMF
ncbi:PREDICTED: receptor-like protein 12 [Ipomoea nil]|uniref:receptor-like protein 12 n=1 Tax=Ipomoea nil TaxID=35883 RepID=UPI0009010F67|nr:PREDICTED: receptor-like protein 12 [Ipomoea nil]